MAENLDDRSLPSVSVLIPTLNSARTLGECLAAIRAQDYPADKIELIVADASSRDGTRAIALEFAATIIENPLTTGEAGKAAAFRASTHELVALIDSDNIVVGKDWLRHMVAPFADPAVVGAEPDAFVAEPSDTVIDRYCAIFGMNDPLCLFIGNYDKFCAATGRWTGIHLKTTACAGYVSVELDRPLLPTFGANGTLYRRSAIDAFVGNYLMDIDIPVRIAATQTGKRFAKVHVGIRHLFCSGVRAFGRKQQRRVRDFLSPKASGDGAREYQWALVGKAGIVRFIVSCLLMFPLLAQSGVAFARTRDRAAFFHPVACWITLAVYGWNVAFARGRPLDRKNWRQ